MTSLYDIPLYYISFNKNEEVERYYNKIGFTDVNHFQAVNGKKFKPAKLLEDKVISFRCYRDLVKGRIEHCGMPTLGGIGCTMSHYTLWKHCVDNNLPYIIITEEDNIFKNDISKEDESNILNAITDTNGIFIGVNIDRRYKIIEFTGTQFCVLSNDACKVLVNYCFPIDVQTDAYIAYLASAGFLSLAGYGLTTQRSHKSYIQDVCVACNISKYATDYNYVLLFIVMFFILLFYITIHFIYKYKNCSKAM